MVSSQAQVQSSQQFSSLHLSAFAIGLGRKPTSLHLKFIIRTNCVLDGFEWQGS